MYALCAESVQVLTKSELCTCLAFFKESIMPKYEKLLQRLSNNDPKLTELNLGCSVTLHGGLYHAHLHDVVSDVEILEIIRAIRPDTHIKKLIFPLHRSINDEIAEVLAKVHIPSLSLSCNKLTEEGGAAIANNPYLLELNIGNTKVGDKTAIACANNTSLLSLDITCNQVTDEGAKALASNHTLKCLNLKYNNKITSKGAISFANNTSLTSLNINGRKLGDEGAKAFAKNNNLSCLYLQHSQITHIGAQALANNCNLQKLYLSNNQIGDEGAIALANNTSITELDLYDTQIGVTGAKALAHNPNLLTLNLSQNKITTEGALAFANHPSLTSFYAQDASINKRQSTRKLNNMLSKNKLKFAERSNIFIMSLLKWACQPIDTANFKILPVEIKMSILLYLDTATFLSLVGIKHFAHIGKTSQQAYECMKFILSNPEGITARLTAEYGNTPIIREKKPELGEYPSCIKHFSFYKPAPTHVSDENSAFIPKRRRLKY